MPEKEIPKTSSFPKFTIITIIITGFLFGLGFHLSFKIINIFFPIGPVG